MDRAEKTGLAIALAGHVGLVALLSLHLAVPPPLPSTEHPIEVSLVQDVGLQQAAPPAPTPPSQSVAPEQGPPEEAAAPAEPAPEPKPVPPPPAPKPQPASKPEPKPVPSKPVAKPKPVEKPAPKLQPKPAETKPKPAPAKPAPARPSARPNASRLASVVADAERAAPARSAKAGEGTSATGIAPRPRGSRLGNDFLKGLSDSPSKAAPSNAAPGAVMSAIAAADIRSAIQRQIQPCADRQVNPGPGAERITVKINLKLNRDGSLAGAPTIVNHSGTDADNRRYLDRVDDLAKAAFTGCAPLRGLPVNLYDVAGGWRMINMNYKLPG